MTTTVTLVVPCYNEASRWDSDYWDRLLAEASIKWVFVNDGSTDQTAAILNHIGRSGRALVVNLPSNSGKAEAVRVGLQSALGEKPMPRAVGFMDADGAFALEDVRMLVAEFEARSAGDQPVDAVWSSRVALAGRDIRRSMKRHYIGRIITTVVSMGWQSVPYDTQSGLKLFAATHELQEALASPMTTRWFVDLELMLRWSERTGRPMRIWEMPVMSWHDVAGSKISSRDGLRIAREVRIIRRMQRHLRASHEVQTSD